MKVITKTIEAFDFAELSDEAKDVVRVRFSSDLDCHFWDHIESFKTFIDGIKPIASVKSWDIDYSCRNRSRVSICLDDALPEAVYYGDLSPARLRTYLLNNLSFLKPQKMRFYKDGHYSVYRDSKVLVDKDSTEYSLTGYGTDYPLLKPILDFINNPYPTDLLQILNDCFYNFFSAVESDYYYYTSDEFLAEFFKDNDYLFTVNGGLV